MLRTGQASVVPRGGFGGDKELVDELCNNLEAVFTSTLDAIGANSKTLMPLEWYHKVYAAATQSHASAELIYKRFTSYMQTELSTKVVQPLVSLLRSHDLTVFPEVSRQYDVFCKFRQFVKCTLQYIDRSHVVRQQQLPVASVMNKIVHDGVVDVVKAVHYEMVLRQANAHRQGEAEHLPQIQGAIQVLTELSLLASSPHHNTGSSTRHTNTFLRAYKAEVYSFYRTATLQLLNSTDGGIEAFAEWMEGRIEFEVRPICDLLSDELMLSVRRILKEVLTAPLIAHPIFGLRALVAASRLHDIRQMYQFLHMLDACVKLMAEEISAAVAAEVEGAISVYLEDATSSDKKDADARLIARFASTQVRFDDLVIASLDSNDLLRSAVWRGFQDAFEVQRSDGDCGTTKSRLDILSEIFAAHLDVLCRRELKEMPMSIEAEMETVVSFVVQLQDKDVFQKAYLSKLSARLLLPMTGVHAECERTVLATLQRVLGNTSSWLEPLITDPTSGLRALVAASRLDNIRQMYCILHTLAGCVEVMAVEISAAVAAEVEALIKIFEDDAAASEDLRQRNPREAEAKLIVSFASIRDRFHALVEASLNGNKLLREGVWKGFREAFNAQRVSHNSASNGRMDVLSEIFAAHLDVLCRRQLNTLDEATEMERVETVVAFVVQLQDKDVFQEVYNQKLARRLLLPTTVVHSECERAVLWRLQAALGKSYTFKMEQKMLDHEATADLQNEFAQEQPDTAGVAEFVVQVITAAHWPAYPSHALTPPQSLEAGMQSFQSFYAKKHATRTLTWLHALGTSQLHICFPKGTKDVTCTLFQACILLCVDEEPLQCCGVERIASLLGLPVALVEPLTASLRHLKMLCDAATPSAPGKYVNELTLNGDFVHKMRKFSIAAYGSSMREAVPTRLVLDRRRVSQVDAAIVRVMKSQSSPGLLYPELVDKTLEQLAHVFVPTPAFIKQRVEDLIVRAYLRRDENNHTLLKFVA